MSYLPRKARTYEPQRRKVGSFASDHAKRKSGLNKLAITRREALALTAFGLAASPGLVEGFEDQLDTKEGRPAVGAQLIPAAAKCR